MTIKKFQGIKPTIDTSVFVDEMAYISGDVSIGSNSSVWPMAVIRGDVNTITIGKRCNIQDGAVLHATHTSEFSSGLKLTLGDDVTVGHNATLHACDIAKRVLVGMGSTILDGAIIENDVILGAGSLVPPNKILTSGYLWMGNPVKQIRLLTNKEKKFLIYSAISYVKLSTLT